jgi:RNA polymerase sigma-32 factor
MAQRSAALSVTESLVSSGITPGELPSVQRSALLASRPARRATADGYAGFKLPDQQLQNREEEPEPSSHLFIDASFGEGGTSMSIDGTRIEYSVQVNSGTFPDRRRLAPVRRKPGAGYLDGVRRFAMLERDHEYMLAKRWREHGDRNAANQLITSHLRLAVKVAMNYRGYGLPVSEIISEGNIGLMQALDRFEPDRGFRFSTYAVWWIRASIQDYILRSWSLVKIGTTASQKKLFFKLRSAKNKIAALQSGDMHPNQVTLIAKQLGVTDREVIDMDRRLGGDSSLNAPIHDEGEAGEWQDYLVDQSPSPEALLVVRDETEHQQKALIHAIGVLNQRERRIFEARHLADAPITLEDLAAEFNVSRERVRQIEVRAFEKVRKAAKNRVETQPHAALCA